MNKKRIVILCSILMVFIIILGIYFFIAKKDVRFVSSNQSLIIFERQLNEENTIERFYCIFNKNGKCESCFCEFDNPPDELLNYDQRSGYIRKNKVGNTLYTEYTGLRGYTKEEIKNMFLNDIIMKEWDK